MKYIDYIRALKAGVPIHTYGHNPTLYRIAQSVQQIKVTIVIPVAGDTYTEYRYEAPVVTVADVEAQPTLAYIRLADRVRYKDGQRIITPQWSGQAYKITGTHGEFTLLEYGNGVIGRKANEIQVVAIAA